LSDNKDANNKYPGSGKREGNSIVHPIVRLKASNIYLPGGLSLVTKHSFFLYSILPREA